jgi:hypothetical protein
MLSEPNKDPSAVSLEAMTRTVEHTIREANLAISVFSLS